MSTKTEVIDVKRLKHAMNYQEYQELIQNLLAEDKTTGDNHSDDYLHYTKMNVQRMQRLEKTVTLSKNLKNELDKLDKKLILLGLTEAWCGDAAQNLPVFQKMAEYTDNISLKLLLRDENQDLMDQYLTNGGRAIPKIIALDADSLEELWTWGPRPENLQHMYLKAKEEPDFDYQETAKDLQKWYANDKTETQQQEIVELLRTA